MNDGAQVQLFGGKHGKTLAQIKTHLIAKHRTRACACAVAFVIAMFQYMAHQVVVLLHFKHP